MWREFKCVDCGKTVRIFSVWSEKDLRSRPGAPEPNLCYKCHILRYSSNIYDEIFKNKKAD